MEILPDLFMKVMFHELSRYVRTGEFDIVIQTITNMKSSTFRALYNAAEHWFERERNKLDSSGPQYENAKLVLYLILRGWHF